MLDRSRMAQSPAEGVEISTRPGTLCTSVAQRAVSTARVVKSLYISWPNYPILKPSSCSQHSMNKTEIVMTEAETKTKSKASKPNKMITYTEDQTESKASKPKINRTNEENTERKPKRDRNKTGTKMIENHTNRYIIST